MPTTRPLNGLNKVYWNMDPLVNANSCEWIELDGVPDLDRLAEAVRLVGYRHPILNSILTRRGLNGYKWIEMDYEMPVDVRLHRLETLTMADAHDRLSNNGWGEHLPLRTGRPIRLHVNVLRDGVILQVITSHVFTDGRSANLVIADLVDAYNSLATGTSWQPVRADVPSRSPFTLFTRHLSASQRLRYLAKGIASLGRDFAQPVEQAGGPPVERGPTGIFMTDLGGELFQRVRRTAKSMNMGRHPLYLVAAIRALSAYNEDRVGRPPKHDFRVIDNFSLRRFGGEATQDIYEICAVPYSLRVDPRKSNAELVRALSDDIEGLKSGGIFADLYRLGFLDVASVLSPKLASLKMLTRHVLKSNFILSNVGDIPPNITALGDVRITDYYSFSQLFLPGELMFFMSVKDGRLRVICLYNRNKFDRAAIATQVIPLFTENLKALCDQFAEHDGAEAMAPRKSA